MHVIKNYYRLAKPGIIYGNLLTTIASFLFASHGHFTFGLFLATAFGISFVIASACVFNNYLDKDLDARMTRTKERALVTGDIKTVPALIYGAVLGILGFSLLSLYVNNLTAIVAAFGFLMYVFIYDIAKRKNEWGALVGTVPGAVPIVVGYTAVVNRLDLTAFLLLLVLVCWQMPHFYGIAIYRQKEYDDAAIPIFPSKRGVDPTKRHIAGFIFLFTIATILLGIAAHLGFIYYALVLVVSFIWLYRGVQGLTPKEIIKGSSNFNETANTSEQDNLWARKIFIFSLVVLLVFCFALASSTIL